uniref:uncharacterized protein LOC120326676 n=1 Tax=Styela clava TaxID=7725 RepID=UPI00193A0F1C|nr:uncharacterized protein LOC120326676 [Styela clava]
MLRLIVGRLINNRRCLHLMTTRTARGMSTGISEYRYFLPIQTRLHDNDFYNHVNNSVYSFYMDTLINNYLLWYCGFDNTKYKRLMVHSSFEFKSEIQYPEILLGAFKVDKIGKSSVSYRCALYSPKLDYTQALPDGHKDPFFDLGIGFHGIVVDKNSLIFDNIVKYYHREPCMLANLVHVFVKKEDKRLKEMPTSVMRGMSKLLVDQAKL